MKLITAFIRPFKLEEVRHALLRFDRVATSSEVKAFIPRRDQADLHGVGPHAFFTKVRIEVIVPKEEVEQAIAILRQAAVTGRLGEGDGLIFVSEIAHAVRIRTGAIDEKAI